MNHLPIRAGGLLAAFVVMATMLSGLVPLPAGAAEPTAIWIEAEAYAGSNFRDQWQVSSMGKPELLSAGQWLMRGLNSEEVDSLVPDQGVTLRYDVPVAVPGEYRLWARVGWFTARAAFAWRIGDGDWQRVPADHPTTNLMELAHFCEVSWADLGPVELPGDTVLEIRYPKVTGEKSRMLMALDCFAFVPGDFLPDGPFPPGESYDGAQDRQAAEHVFRLPPPTGADRTEVELSGLWQVARYDDPDMDRDTYQPVVELPAGQRRWMGFQVPGNWCTSTG